MQTQTQSSKPQALPCGLGLQMAVSWAGPQATWGGAFSLQTCLPLPTL